MRFDEAKIANKAHKPGLARVPTSEKDRVNMLPQFEGKVAKLRQLRDHKQYRMRRYVLAQQIWAEHVLDEDLQYHGASVRTHRL